MPGDPVLDLLLSAERTAAEAHRAARAALVAYRGDAAAAPEDDLVHPREAEARYSISPDTRVRWAKVEGLGIKTEKGWCLKASLVKRYRGR